MSYNFKSHWDGSVSEFIIVLRGELLPLEEFLQRFYLNSDSIRVLFSMSLKFGAVEFCSETILTISNVQFFPCLFELNTSEKVKGRRAVEPALFTLISHLQAWHILKMKPIRFPKIYRLNNYDDIKIVYLDSYQVFHC